MVQNRKYHTATLLLDGRVLVAGGIVIGSDGGPVASASVELYDPESGTWAATGEMAEVRYNHSATLLADGSVLVTGGWNSLIDPPPSSSAELYDPVSGSWSRTGQMITPRLSHTATLLRSGRVLVTGGWHDGQSIGPAELYDPGKRTWTATAPLPEARDGQTATLLSDGKVLVAGGRSASAPDGIATTLLYDPATGTWTATGDMIDGRNDHSTTLLDDGRVLVTGGEAGGAAPVGLRATELFDAVTGTWTPTGPMIAARRGNTATVLADGTVLVTGNNWEDPSPAAERYNPASGNWAATTGMFETVYGHTATRLLDGRVLVAGGGESTTAEIFDPRGGSG